VNLKGFGWCGYGVGELVERGLNFKKVWILDDGRENQGF